MKCYQYHQLHFPITSLSFSAVCYKLSSYGMIKAIFHIDTQPCPSYFGKFQVATNVKFDIIHNIFDIFFVNT